MHLTLSINWFKLAGHSLKCDSNDSLLKKYLFVIGELLFPLMPSEWLGGRPARYLLVCTISARSQLITIQQGKPFCLLRVTKNTILVEIKKLKRVELIIGEESLQNHSKFSFNSQ